MLTSNGLFEDGNMQNFDWFGAFVNWFPMMLLIGVWAYFLRKMRSGGMYPKYQADYLEVARRQADTLERIAVALEKR
jgi:ATP-dependent Zn protease